LYSPFFFLQTQKIFFKQELISRGESLSKALADSIKTDLSVSLALGEISEEDRLQFGRACSSIREQEDIAYAVIEDPQGNLIASSETGGSLMLSAREKGAVVDAVLVSANVGGRSGKFWEIRSVPVMDMDGSLLAYVRLGVDRERMNKTLTDFTWKVSGMIVLLILICVLITYFVSMRIIVYPIQRSASAVSDSGQGLARISEQATQTTLQLAGVINQISQSTSSIAQSTQGASSSSQTAMEISRKGRELTEKLLSKMQNIQSSVSKSEEAIENLGKRSEKIGEIVIVITKIADQTNLLSLNAAIEAARAGESGRGFAVVADEIRKLAEHSASSAQEISKLVSEVQHETDISVKVTEVAAREVDEGGKIMIETEKGLQSILESVENVTRQIEQIAAAAEELAASTEEASSSSQEQTATIEEVSRSAQNLNRTAEDLKNFVIEVKRKAS